jgi:hypothetical protein
MTVYIIFLLSFFLTFRINYDILGNVEIKELQLYRPASFHIPKDIKSLQPNGTINYSSIFYLYSDSNFSF